MAIIHSIPKILKTKFPETYIEENLLVDFFDRNLDDSYEVFHRPQLNGDQPPFVIMRKGFGALLINIFNQPILNYDIDGEFWYYEDTPFISPFSQANRYKENIYNLHSDSLRVLTTRNPYHLNIFQTMVCFTEETTSTVKEILSDALINKNADRELKFAKYIGNDVVENNDINHIIKNGWLNKKSQLFTESIYNSLSRYLIPSFHSRDEGQILTYSPKQRQFIESAAGNKKIKGVVGSGKTYILAKRAVNASLRTGNDVLILTYNITLRNYLKEFLNRVKEDFYWDNFFINNYHNFFNQQAIKAGFKVKSLRDYQDTNFFDDTRFPIQKFDTILIDEIQDYERTWIENIRKYFLKDDGEYVVFGDEKQNIYQREMEKDKKPYSGISGQWNLLNESFRSQNEIIELAQKFQEEYLDNKYDHEIIKSGRQFTIEDQLVHMDYISLPRVTRIEDIYKYINKTISKNKIHPEDITVLTIRRNLLRQLDYLWRENKKELTSVTFDDFEIYFDILLKLLENKPTVNEGLKFLKTRSNLVTAIAYELYDRIFDTPKLDTYLAKFHLSREEFLKWLDLFTILEATLVKDPMLIENVDELEKLTTAQEEERKVITKKLLSRLDVIQRNRKIHFRHQGLTKFSTIHSYKGWESQTVFLILEGTPDISEATSSPEIIYTGLTRAMTNLFIINTGNIEYSGFFSENMNYE